VISVPPVTLRRIWRFVGWFGFALLLYLSFAPQPPEVPIEDGDKLGHALAYAVLMFWWAQLLDAGRQRLLLAGGLVALGIAIEFVQGGTGWRTFDHYDMLADAIGIAAGGTLTTIIPNVLKVGGEGRPR
jgi:VanZ family protein